MTLIGVLWKPLTEITSTRHLADKHRRLLGMCCGVPYINFNSKQFLSRTLKVLNPQNREPIKNFINLSLSHTQSDIDMDAVNATDAKRPSHISLELDDKLNKKKKTIKIQRTYFPMEWNGCGINGAT